MNVVRAAAAALMLASYSAAQSPPPAGTSGVVNQLAAKAALKDARGETIGDATLRQTPNGVLLKVDLRNVSAGVHGLHIHDVGRCEAPAFESAGEHYAPADRTHGFLDARGPHAGDLPNIHVPESGQLAVEFMVQGVTLKTGSNTLLDPNGSALVLHEQPDDYHSEPSGNAGNRLACGVIAPVGGGMKK